MLTLNIETVPTERALAIPFPADDYAHKVPEYAKEKDREERIAAWWLKTEARWREDQEYSLNPLWGRVVAIGQAVDDQEPEVFLSEDEDLEAGNVSECFRELAPTLITFNGLAFDLPFLRVRAAALGVNLSTSVPFSRLLARYRTDAHFDVRAVITNWDNRVKGTLADCCHAFGITPPVGSGADVWPAYQRGDFDFIEQHCRSNVEATRALYRRLAPYQ